MHEIDASGVPAIGRDAAGGVRGRYGSSEASSHYSEHEHDLDGLICHLERILSQRLARCLSAADISVREWRVLSCLADRSGRAMTDIAEFIPSPAPTTTKLIEVMVSRNLVYRRSDDADRRRVLIFLARRGKEKYERLAPLVAKEQAQLSSFAVEEDLHELARLLTQPSRVG